jgi:hypothetical protein
MAWPSYRGSCSDFRARGSASRSQHIALDLQYLAGPPLFVTQQRLWFVTHLTTSTSASDVKRQLHGAPRQDPCVVLDSRRPRSDQADSVCRPNHAVLRRRRRSIGTLGQALAARDWCVRKRVAAAADPCMLRMVGSGSVGIIVESN